MASLWEWAKERWWDSDAKRYIVTNVDPVQVDKAKPAEPLVANCTYFRLRVAEMFLKKELAGGRTWYPAVHSLVRFDFGDHGTTDVPNIVDPVIGQNKPDGASDVVVRGLALTPPMPFSGGNVAINACLVAVQAGNNLTNFIGVLEGFAGLLAVPQLSAAVKMAQPLAAGIQQLFGGGNGSVHIGIKLEGGAAAFTRGYAVAIRATEAEVKMKRLWVVAGQLREGDSMDASKPFDRFDYLLLETEIFDDRDDWNKLTYVAEPFKQAIDSLAEGEDARAQVHLQTAKRSIWKSQDLTQADRTRVIAMLQEAFNQAKGDLGTKKAVDTDTAGDLQAVMRRAMPATAALRLPEPTLSDVFAIE